VGHLFQQGLVVRSEGVEVIAIKVEHAENPLAMQQRHNNL
jgi:hypothetical protein